MNYLIDKLIMVPMVLAALVFHELAHGWVSGKLGDPTPKMTGRMTLNPLAHLDPIGAVLMILTGFGWAKPVEINPRYYKNPKKGMALTALAGPLANLALSIAAFIIYGIIYIIYEKTGFFANSIFSITGLLWRFVTLNLSFMVFNFIPIPPLDGSRILGLFLSDRAYFKIQEYERYSFILIILLSASGAFDAIITGGVSTIFYNMLSVFSKLMTMVV